MEILAIGFGLSIAWYLGKLIFDIIGEIIFTRLHKNKYYNIITGKRPRELKSKSQKVKSITGGKMGF